MLSLRQLAIRLAHQNTALQPLLLPLLKTANGADIKRAVEAALKGWEPQLSAHGFTLQLYALLKADRNVQKRLTEDLRHAHLRDWKLDWADWFARPVLAWSRGRTKLEQRGATKINYKKVVQLLVADHKREWEKLQQAEGRVDADS